MKKLITAGLTLALLAAMTGASASEAGTLSDPLITREYLEQTYKTELVAALTKSVSSSLQAVYDRYAGASDPGVQGAVYTDGRVCLSAPSGAELTVYTGGLIIPVEGNMCVTAVSGQLIDVSAAAPVSAGSTLAAGRRYICAEDSEVRLSAISTTVFMLEGPYTTSSDLTYNAKPTPEPNVFPDVPADAWYAEAVAKVTERGLILGDQNGNFNPEQKTGRGQLMTILARLSGVDTTGSDPWYKAGMDWAVAAGISDGHDPLNDLPREQFVTMLYRYMKSPAVTGDLSAYPDAGKVNDWAYDAMVWAIENGLVTGTDRGTLEPGEVANRAVAATILSRFLDKFDL